MRITIFTAGILGLIYFALSAWVVVNRTKTKVLLGDGSEKPEAKSLFVAIRAHGNFSEYVPLALILLAADEARRAPHILCVVLALMLIAGRAIHPFGMTMKAPNPFRAGGAVLTWTMILVASITALVLVA